MIQLDSGRAGRLAIRISGFAAAAMTVFAAWAAIQSAAEWQGIKTIAAIFTFGSLCIFSALMARYCFALDHEMDGVGDIEPKAEGSFPVNLPKSE